MNGPPAAGAVAPQPEPRKRAKIDPVEGGRLEQLLIVNKQAHDAAAEADEREEEYKAAIKAWLLSLYPDPAELPGAFDIAADPHGRYPAYTMTLKAGSHMDVRAMERDGVYDTYSVPSKPGWELRESGGSRRR
jgi:hypothetical protein